MVPRNSPVFLWGQTAWRSSDLPPNTGLTAIVALKGFIVSLLGLRRGNLTVKKRLFVFFWRRPRRDWEDDKTHTTAVSYCCRHRIAGGHTK